MDGYFQCVTRTGYNGKTGYTIRVFQYPVMICSSSIPGKLQLLKRDGEIDIHRRESIDDIHGSSELYGGITQ